MGEEGSQQTGWPGEWKEPGSSSCSTSYSCLMVRICSSIPDLLGEKHHCSAVDMQVELWEKPGGKARSGFRSLPQKQLYWAMFGFWGQKGKWKVRAYHTYKCPLEHSVLLLQRWAGCTTQINAYILILASFPLFLTWYCMSWGSSCPTWLHKPCCNSFGKAMFGAGLLLGTGTHGEPSAHHPW